MCITDSVFMVGRRDRSLDRAYSFSNVDTSRKMPFLGLLSNIDDSFGAAREVKQAYHPAATILVLKP